MIYKVDGGYVISSRRVWMPGIYECERAAKYASKFSDDVLSELNHRINIKEDRSISFKDLQNEYKKQK